MKKLYIGCALTHASKGFVKQVLDLRDRLSRHFTVLQFVGIEDVADTEIFTHDIGCARKCDALVAITDHPSYGLGYESAIAVESGKRVFSFAHESARVSKFITGNNNPNYSFHRFISFHEIYNIVCRELIGRTP
jgi:hypothetical protein